LGADLRGLSLSLGLHAAENRQTVGLGQIGALDAHVHHGDAETLCLGVDLLGDVLHQRMALVAHNGFETRGAKHAPERRLKDGTKP